GGNNYARLRCGIGRDFHPGQQADYVLGEWNNKEREGLPTLVDTAGAMALSFCAHGLQNTMNKYNQGKKKKSTKPKPQEGSSDK
ncbi:MAG: aminoacyl-tRNA hydrolase, partial [Bacteroidota bacterium]